MIFDPFDVVVMPFPFTDKSGAKRRPALVISSTAFNGEHDQSILAMITTAKQSDWPSDIHLKEWHMAGLTVPCRVRFKLFTVDNQMIVKRLGGLAECDRHSVQVALSQCLVH